MTIDTDTQGSRRRHPATTAHTVVSVSKTGHQDAMFAKPANFRRIPGTQYAKLVPTALMLHTWGSHCVEFVIVASSRMLVSRSQRAPVAAMVPLLQKRSCPRASSVLLGPCQAEKRTIVLLASRASLRLLVFPSVLFVESVDFQS